MNDFIKEWSGELMAIVLVTFIGAGIAAVQWFSGMCHL